GEEGTPMLRVLTDDDAHAELTCGLDEIVREGARRMLVVALEAEVDGYVSAFVDRLDERGY
nr:IS256 family transposase [Actinomycetota bacterium]